MFNLRPLRLSVQQRHLAIRVFHLPAGGCQADSMSAVAVGCYQHSFPSGALFSFCHLFFPVRTSTMRRVYKEILVCRLKSISSVVLDSKYPAVPVCQDQAASHFPFGQGSTSRNADCPEQVRQPTFGQARSMHERQTSRAPSGIFTSLCAILFPSFFCRDSVTILGAVSFVTP